MQKTIGEIAKIINGVVVGNDLTKIYGVTNTQNPINGYITFIEKESLLAEIENSEISCAIAPLDLKQSSKTLICVEKPKLAFSKIAQLFNPPRIYSGKISEKAEVSNTAKIGTNVTIEAFAVIGENVTIGDNTVIRGGTYIDFNTIIGKNCVIIHASTVIGSDGFGYTREPDGNHIKVPQIGNVIIEDDVELGSNVSIDRATFGSTIIKKNAKIDNLCQIAHNVTVGENTAISGLSGIAGSSKIGKNCTLAAQVGIADHCIIEDNVIIGGQAGIASKKTLHSGQIYMGTPARDIHKFMKQNAALNRLPKLAAEIKKLL